MPTPTWTMNYFQVGPIVESQPPRLADGTQDPDVSHWVHNPSKIEGGPYVGAWNIDDEAQFAFYPQTLNKGQIGLLEWQSVIDNDVKLTVFSIGSKKTVKVRLTCVGYQDAPIFERMMDGGQKFGLITPALGASLTPAPDYKYVFADPRVVTIPNSLGGQGIPTTMRFEIEAVTKSPNVGSQLNTWQIRSDNTGSIQNWLNEIMTYPCKLTPLPSGWQLVEPA